MVFGSGPDSGVSYWSPTTDFEPVLGSDNNVWTGSPDANALGQSPIVSSGPYIGPGTEGSGFLLIREPLGRAALGLRTRPVGIGTDAEKALLSSRNADSVGAGPGDKESLYVWTRTG